MSDTPAVSLHDPLPEYAGWFGKIPSLGDFVRRNLPESFVERWDEWLSEELSEAQTALTDDWSQLWRHAPVWCFALGAGVLDARSWLGVLVPSVDRVGREFPLTIALSPGRHVAAPGAAWWAALEALGRSAVGPDGGAARLDEGLAAFLSAHSELAHDLEPAATGAECTLAVPAEGTSAWWCMPAGEGREAAALVLPGLPRGDAFRLLLQRSSAG
ncbi:MAG TPA: type VI secretion system-associated protein TagF [Steroidobacteraceae bacterium]|nr:type VI secretion system-associated protein TagF [Steroidobacteraceae bacterium]